MQDIEKIYQEYANMLYKYVFCLTGKEDISEEIVQETFEVAIKNINKFEGKCKISTWLCQIAKYIWYGKSKKKNRTNQRDGGNVSFSFSMFSSVSILFIHYYCCH